VKAVQLIRDAELSTAKTVLVEAAFEMVWPLLEGRFHDRRSLESARLRLAGILLLLARVVTDEDFLTSAALRAFNGADPTHADMASSATAPSRRARLG
jgi:hypothetical protein